MFLLLVSMNWFPPTRKKPLRSSTNEKTLRKHIKKYVAPRSFERGKGLFGVMVMTRSSTQWTASTSASMSHGLAEFEVVLLQINQRWSLCAELGISTKSTCLTSVRSRLHPTTIFCKEGNFMTREYPPQRISWNKR
jgi:hypothetical protein